MRDAGISYTMASITHTQVSDDLKISRTRNLFEDKERSLAGMTSLRSSHTHHITTHPPPAHFSDLMASLAMQRKSSYGSTDA